MPPKMLERETLSAPVAGLLDHFEDMLRAGRADQNDPDSARAQLLQEWRGNVVDASGQP